MKFKQKIKDYQITVRVKMGFGEDISESEINMFMQKNLRGLMKAKKIRKGVVDYTAPISVTVEEYLKKPINSYDFFLMIEQVVDTVKRVQKNNLVVNRMLLDIKNVFINQTTKEIHFIYIPVINGDVKSNIMEFLYSIIYAATPADAATGDQISRFTYFLKNESGYNSKKIENYIEKVNPHIIKLVKNTGTSHSGFIADKLIDYYEHYDSKAEEDGTMPLSEEYTSGMEGTMPLMDEFDETAPLDDEEEETGMLDDSAFADVNYPVLCRQRTGETVKINKPVYRIGKERSYVDFFIADNTKISRSHVDIIRRGERYYVKDLGSKNKTYINNRMIMPQQENEIFSDDTLRLADEDFTFKM